MLCECELWADPAGAGMVLAALAVRTTPFELCLKLNHVGETQAQRFTTGTQLTQLITRGRLEALQLSYCNFGEAGLAPIFAALSLATRLESLKLLDEVMSGEFARDVVLPAVRANNSLLELIFYEGEDEGELLPELIEAQNIVNAR